MEHQPGEPPRIIVIERPDINSPGLTRAMNLARTLLRTVFLSTALSAIAARLFHLGDTRNTSARGWILGFTTGLVIGPFVRFASRRGKRPVWIAIEEGTKYEPEVRTFRELVEDFRRAHVSIWIGGGSALSVYGCSLFLLIWVSAAASPWGAGRSWGLSTASVAMVYVLFPAAVIGAILGLIACSVWQLPRIAPAPPSGDAPGGPASG